MERSNLNEALVPSFIIAKTQQKRASATIWLKEPIH